uniref:Uncharacterized protein n=1 Tax=Parascaris univalens TaxID=6257 RepID=A0A915C7C9_PARUN
MQECGPKLWPFAMLSIEFCNLQSWQPNCVHGHLLLRLLGRRAVSCKDAAIWRSGSGYVEFNIQLGSDQVIARIFSVIDYNEKTI